MISIVTDNQNVELDIKKITKINITEDKEFIYFDKLSDGSWGMVYSTNKIRNNFKDK